MRNRWIETLSAFSAGVVIAILQNKVVPCLLIIKDEFSLSSVTAGWVSSIFCLAGAIMVFPAAAIVERIGIKKSCLISLICAFLGSILGIIANSYIILLIGRFVEGLSLGIISTAVPTLIGIRFSAEERGVPMGIWASWQYIAQMICFFFGNGIAQNYGWRGLWTAGILCIFIAFIVCATLMSNVKVVNEGIETRQRFSVRKGLGCSKDTWIVSFIMLIFCACCFGFITWIAYYWTEALQLDTEIANKYVSIFSFASIPLVIGFGYIINKVSHKRFTIISAIGYSLVLAMAFFIKTKCSMYIFLVLYPLAEAAISTALWIVITETVSETKKLPIAIALFNFLGNLGMLIGPPMTGFIIEYAGWETTSIALTVAMLLAVKHIVVVKLQS